jgi:hypothetical protein
VTSVAERIAVLLTPVLGAFNAKIWVRTIAERELGLQPEQLDRSHVAVIAKGIRASLSTFVGRSGADQLVERIQREVV